MTETHASLADARRYMQQAKALLADAGLIPAATYLDYAIASIDRADQDGDGAPHATAPQDPVLVRALGGAMAIIGTVLARSDIIALEELGDLFGIFGTISAREDPAMAAIVAGWGGMILDAALKITRPDAV